MAGNSIDDGRTVTSKVVAILLAFADGAVHTLTETSRLTGIPMSTAHRLIGELASSGILERAGGFQYGIGPSLRDMCLDSPRSATVEDRAVRVMEDLSVVGSGCVRFGMLADGRIRYLEKRSVDRPLAARLEDRCAPAHATAMGKAVLAFSPTQTVDDVVSKGLRAYTGHTICSGDELRAALGQIRLSRLSVSREEWVLGMSALAVPVFTAGGKVVGALELTVSDLRADLRRLHPLLVLAARGLSRELAGSASLDRVARARRGYASSPSAAREPEPTRSRSDL